MKVLKKIVKVLLAIVLIIACIAVIGLNYKTVLAGHKIKDIVDSAIITVSFFYGLVIVALIFALRERLKK